MNVYRIVVLEIQADVTLDGVAVTEVEAARYIASPALTPQDAILAWAGQIETEEAS